MKLLLTGQPKSGKSTILADIIADISPKQGLTSPEVRENEERIGFDLRSAQGNTAVLSRVKVATDYPVGRYYVDLASLERFIAPLFNHTGEQLLFIDEIGQMQLYSEDFKKLVSDYIEAQNDFIGTVSQVYDHPFIDSLVRDKDILVCTVTPENRTLLRATIVEALNNREAFNLLTKIKQRKVLELARGYLANEQYTSFKKLFKNAVPYITDGKVRRYGDGFIIKGNTNDHRVQIEHGQFVCDCDFFNGRGQYADNMGECSHIQSAKLFSS